MIWKHFIFITMKIWKTKIFLKCPQFCLPLYKAVIRQVPKTILEKMPSPVTIRTIYSRKKVAESPFIFSFHLLSCFATVEIENSKIRFRIFSLFLSNEWSRPKQNRPSGACQVCSKCILNRFNSLNPDISETHLFSGWAMAKCKIVFALYPPRSPVFQILYL